MAEEAQEVSRIRFLSGARREWKFVLKFLVFSFILWQAQLWYQLLVLTPNDPGLAVTRADGFAAATLISLALLSSILFKFRPAMGRYWYVRRSLGVMGFVFLFHHFIAALSFVYGGSLEGMYFSLNPLENPIVFGTLAFPIFFVMFLTSTDWAVKKLGYKKWKAIHRLVYFGFALAVFHFITINPPALMNPAGYSLLGIVFLVLTGELYWFIQTVRKKRSSRIGTLVGILAILFWLFLGLLVFGI